MPLSEQEQRLLDEMERSLYHNDADFVAHVGVRRGRANYRAIALGVIIAIVGVIGLVAGVALNVLILGIAGFLVMFAGVLVALTPGKRRASAETAAPPSAKTQAKSSGGFMDRLNDRWDNRQDPHGS